MIINILSENNYLADILHKNPDTDQGLYAKTLKEGIVIGNVASKTKYEVLFHDQHKSYTNDPSNQLDYQSLCNPLIILNICTELFGHLLKDKESYSNQAVSWLNKTRGEIDVISCQIEVPVFYINSNWYRNGSFLLEKYFSEICVEHNVGANYTLTVSGNCVFEAINLLNLVAIFTHLTNEDRYDTFIDNSMIEKYIRVLTNLNEVPYFVFYLFIKRAVKNQTQFQMVKPIFEQYLAAQGLTASFTNEDTQRSRIRFITESIGIELPVLDIGCGEFSYYKRLMNMGLKAMYYGVDKEQRLERLGQSIMHRLESENLCFSTDLNHVDKSAKLNIIISEVIEHNSIEDAVMLIRSALNFNFDKLIISTPNADFNKYYYGRNVKNDLNQREAAAFRHIDHQFEFTQVEFQDFMTLVLQGRSDCQVVFDQVGDQINGVQPTQLATIKKMTNESSR
ncbi:hypothetical protein GCM10027566_20260 [Arachidicoccus ginsenosidivorans]|uniref:Small RNA 2'-O-methyltransferase n=1 Tax=Arachidicoccus ginsenosidivorans TaxID=496057 RepID=A0A5B8VKC0_9BACT|nr:hypothetical protein [Arachidicoccus ginsenosidivorans]QEC72024.1 hypothetical protein FSB73_10460 [Arachidicoccus ginsenosidivorans]